MTTKRTIRAIKDENQQQAQLTVGVNTKIRDLCSVDEQPLALIIAAWLLPVGKGYVFQRKSDAPSKDSASASEDASGGKGEVMKPREMGQPRAHALQFLYVS